MGNDHEVLTVLTELLEQASLSRLQVLSKRNNITIEKNPLERLVYGHWMSLILLSGKNVRILFKVHFFTNTANFFAKKTYQLSTETISKSRAVDFFREFCNLTAGNVKITLASNNIDVGISLPILTRGFDDIFYPRTYDTKTLVWSLQCEGQRLFCSAHISILDQFSVTKSSDESIPVGEVEFL